MAVTFKKNPGDIIFSFITAFAACTVVFFIIGILFVLIKESSLAREKFGIVQFLTTTEWNPVTENFGALTTIYGTFMTTVLSLVMAIPVALGIAIFVTEIAPTFLKGPIGIAIELLAAIPSIIYGMWGLFTLSPLMRNYIEPFLQKATAGIPLVNNLFQGTPMGIDILTASIILSIMIIPFTASIARDAFNLTPSIVKESAYALGATQWEVVKDIVIPYSKLGVFGGILFSLGRAIGETMAVAFVLGNNHKMFTSFFDSAATITVTLANEFTEADKDIYLSSLFYLALVLFTMSFIFLAIAKFFLLKAERRYSR
ncbi:MAG: phosphate ABC transporter permease subunit PstC [Syntrophales bacterium]